MCTQLPRYGRGGFQTPTITKHGLPEIVLALKTFSAQRITELRGIPGAPVWQRNYYEHIIHNDESLHNTREYITNNPMRWELDRHNPDILWRVSNPSANGDNHGESDRIWN